MAGRHPEHRVRWPAMRQAWRDVVFVHHAYPPDDVAARLPEGFAVDTHDGTAWVGLSAFQVAACGVGPLPPLPLWSFPETNLRIYVVGPDGTDGIWFLTIEAQTYPVTVGARLAFGAPYHHGTLAVDRDGDQVRYHGRRDGSDVGYDLRIRIGEPTTDAGRTGLVDWCTGRWRAWTTQLGLALRSPVAHQPWPLHDADLLDVDESLTTAAGLPPPAGDPLVHYAPGVDAHLAAPRPTLRPPGRLTLDREDGSV